VLESECFRNKDNFGSLVLDVLKGHEETMDEAGKTAFSAARRPSRSTFGIKYEIAACSTCSLQLAACYQLFILHDNSCSYQLHIACYICSYCMLFILHAVHIACCSYCMLFISTVHIA
jgi:hypothetical protein